MPSDALHYSLMAEELNGFLSDGKLEKITMPERDEIILGIRSRGKNFCLIISAAPACPRCHLTQHSKDNPAVAPAFLMHLRKHIGGAKVLGVECLPFERVLKIKLLTRNELAVEDCKTLVAEIMGKYSNIILVNSDGTISDCIRRVNLDTSSKRQVLPGLKYLPAPVQARTDISDEQTVKAVLRGFNGGNLSSYLLKHLRGLAPVSIEEAVFRALGDNQFAEIDDIAVNKVFQKLQGLYDFSDVSPCVRYTQLSAADFYMRRYECVSGDYKYFSTLSEAMDEFFFARDKANRFNEKSRHLSALLKTAITRTEKKLSGFLEKQQECADLDNDKLFGELLTANIYRIGKGMQGVNLENYYNEYKTVYIPLDNQKSAQANAQNYFKKYAKKKKTLQQLEAQIESARTQLDYYGSISPAFSLCTEISEIEDLQREMELVGLLKSKPSSKKKSNSKPSSPLTVTFEGFAIRIGKNNVQNDELTKSAKKDDIWLHTQKIHGSHVVISAEGKQIPDSVILRAAQHAAYYSKAALSQNVPVDYTAIKYVDKPKSAPPGKVIYTHHNTVYVNPMPANA